MSLAERLLAAAERNPSTDAVVSEGVRLDYAELVERARRGAGGLSELGVGAGDRVAAALRNTTDALVLYWAAQWLGACYVPINWRLTAADIGYCATDAEAAVLFVEPDVAVDAGDVRTVEGAGGLAGSAAAGDPAAVSELDPALMLYTSGTTGRPKGVPRTHGAEWSAALAHVIQCRYEPGERTLGVMPWYHTMGVRSLLAMVALDGCLVVQPTFRPAPALDAVAAERVGALYLAPTLFHDLVREARSRQAPAPAVPRLAYAGSPMTPALVAACVETFRPEVFVNHYGSTEIYTFSVHADQVAKPGCAGRPGVHSRLRLVGTGPDAGPGDVVAAGGTGQVACALSSPEAFGGYWHRPDADAKGIRDGWYLTGDLGQLDADGDLWVLGRVDDMVITGGENVYPVEVEDVLSAHPEVREVAVVGVADERLGQEVVACVVAEHPGAVDAATLDAFCLSSGRLAPFKRPRRYRFMDQLPKTSSGKVLRHRLRAEVAEPPEDARP